MLGIRFGMSVAIAALLVPSALASSYFIDPISCTGTWMTLVSNGMLNAFKMAHAGIDMGQNPDADQTTLITSLFGFVTIYNQYVDGVLGTTTGVLRFEGNQVLSRDNLGVNDLQIYCDQDRYREIPKRPQFYFDPNIKAADFFKDYQNECTTKPYIKGLLDSSKLPTLAYTIHPNPEEFSGTSKNWPWQIQICPWILGEAALWNFQFTAGLGTQIVGKAAKVLLQVPFVSDFTKVDKLSLFDKMILHELTHTVTDDRYVTTDVTDDNGNTIGYGWNACRAIAMKESETNADSWALYGSASLLRQMGVTINADGSVTKS